MVQGPSGVRKQYQGVAEQPWGYGDPMVVHARTPSNFPPPEGPRYYRRPPNKFRKAPSRQAVFLNQTMLCLQTSPPQHRLAGRSLSEGCGGLAPWSRGPLASGNGTRGWRNNHGDMGTPWLCRPGPRIKFLRQRAPDTTAGPLYISFSSFPPEPAYP